VRRVCVLTGAGGYLGNAFCHAYAKSYDIVAVYHDRVPEYLIEGQQALDPLNLEDDTSANVPSVFAVRAELTDNRDLERIVELSLARFGRIDLLVNGAVHSRWGSMVETDYLMSEAALQFEVNVLVPLRLSVLMARHFWRDRERENRRLNRNIVNISSTAGHMAYPCSGQSVYAASKAALDMLTRHIAAEFGAFGVRANSLAPNSFPTIVPVGDVVRGIVDLDRGVATGTVMPIDRPAADARARQKIPHRGGTNISL
jgi:NAD(P)-dependent dehydrogenase (short-subunit alcohol dehydrogenase family)